MNRFEPALRSVARELDAPPSARSAILLEMAADLESVYRHHRDRGAGEAEAIERAQAMVLGSAEVVKSLSRLHGGTWRGWSEGIAVRLTRGADLLLLLAGVLPSLVLATMVAAPTLSASPSALVWPLLTVGGLTVLLIGVEGARIVVGGRGGSTRLPVLLALAAAAPGLGLLAAALAGWSAAASLATAAGHPDLDALVEVGVAGALLLTGLLVGLAGLLGWFGLTSRIARQARRDVEAVFAGPPSLPPVAPNVHPLVRRRRA